MPGSPLQLVQNLAQHPFWSGMPEVAAALTRGKLLLLRRGDRIQIGQDKSKLYIPLTAGFKILSDGQSDGPPAYQGLPLGVNAATQDQDLLLVLVARSQAIALEVPFVEVSARLSDHSPLSHYLRVRERSAALLTFDLFLWNQGFEFSSILEIFSNVSSRSQNYVEHFFRAETLLFAASGTASLATSRDQEGNWKRKWIGAGDWWKSDLHTVETQNDLVIHLLQLDALRDRDYWQKLSECLKTEPGLVRARTEHASPTALSVKPGIKGRPLSEAEIRFHAFEELPLVRASSDSDPVQATFENYFRIKGLSPPFPDAYFDLRIRKPLTHHRVAEAFETRGFHASSHHFSPSLFPREGLPGIVLFKMNLVILAGWTKTEAILADSEQGWLAVPKEEFLQDWDGCVFSLEKRNTDGIVGASLRTLYRRHGPRGLLRWSLLGMAAASGILALFTPIFFQSFVHSALGDRDPGLVLRYLALFLGSGGLICGIGYLKRKAVADLNQSVQYRLGSALYAELMDRSPGPGMNLRSGEEAALFMEIRRISSFLISFETNIFGRSISLVMLLGGVFFLSSWAALYLLILFVALTICFRVFYHASFRLLSKSLQNRMALMGVLGEGMGALTVIKATNAEKTMSERWENVLLEYLGSREDLLRQLNHSTSLIRVGVTLSVLGILFSAFSGILTIDAARATSFTLYLFGILGLLMDLPQEVLGFAFASSAWKRIQDRLQGFSSDPSERRGMPSLKLKGAISFEDVSFRYTNSDSEVLSRITFRVQPGEVLAVVGKSGSGKSTLGKICAGLMQPTKGRVLYDGVDNREVSTHAIRSQIGMIQQDNALFSGTIHSNLRFAEDTWAAEDLQTAIRRSNADKFIEEQPQGAHQVLGESGTGLSGGEKQRISIARMLIRDPRILVMDEATSSLDVESEAKVVENLEEILAGKTAILITHRLSTILCADRILVLEDGMVREEGTHEHLMATGKFYPELVQRQFATGKVG